MQCQRYNPTQESKIHIDICCHCQNKKVQVGKDQEKAQSEKESLSKIRDGKKQINNQVLIP